MTRFDIRYQNEKAALLLKAMHLAKNGKEQAAICCQMTKWEETLSAKEALKRLRSMVADMAAAAK